MSPKRRNVGRNPRKLKSKKTQTSASGYSRIWPANIPLPEDEQIFHLRHSFSFAHGQTSESFLYEFMNESFLYPAEYFMDKYACLIHWTPQDLLLYRRLVERQALDDARAMPAALPRQTRTAIEVRARNPELFLEDFTLDSADIVQLESRRITDFLLAISSLGPKDLPTSRALISVIEGKSLPEWVEDLGGDEELEAAKEVAVQALPQLLEQAQHAFEHYPSQDELWGIIVVGRCCQFYKFERACVEKLKFPTFKASDRLTTDDAEKYATLVDDTHFIFDPVLDCYTEMFIKRMEDMMAWASNTFLG